MQRRGGALRTGGASTVQEDGVLQEGVIQEEGVIQRVNSESSKELRTGCKQMGCPWFGEGQRQNARSWQTQPTNLWRM